MATRAARDTGTVQCKLQNATHSFQTVRWRDSIPANWWAPSTAEIETFFRERGGRGNRCNRGVKRHILARNALGPMQQIEFLRVLEMPVSCWPITALKYFLNGRHTQFCRYPREPQRQWRWILPDMRRDWAPTEHATTIKESFSHNCGESSCKHPVVSKLQLLLLT